jgi:hypothetical protein
MTGSNLLQGEFGAEDPLDRRGSDAQPLAHAAVKADLARLGRAGAGREQEEGG